MNFCLLALSGFHILVLVKAGHVDSGRITQFAFSFATTALLLSVLLALPWGGVRATDETTSQDRDRFIRAWQSAAHGDRSVFRQLMPGLQDYVLYPYLQYEDYRFRRASVDPGEMDGFLDSHSDWAFTAGLRNAWLKTLGDKQRWDALLLYGAGATDAELRCHYARARIVRGQTQDLLPTVQALWTVGQSQPDACDPVFKWLIDRGGVTPGLAWERIRLAMEARQPRLTLYLARFLPVTDRIWAERWQQQDRGAYLRLDRAKQWPDLEKGRTISSYGLRRLARSEPDRAWKFFTSLDRHFNWTPDVRAGILREIALWSAVEGSPDTPRRMSAVPETYRDGKLLEWWARQGLGEAEWDDVISIIASMPPELKDDARWRYWDARARLETGDPESANELLNGLAQEASYYGFLSADLLGYPYTICPAEPAADPAKIEELKFQPGFQRVIELRDAGLGNWSRSEWKMATRPLDRDGLRLAAALATQEGWSDLAISALGDSGDKRWYEWRFPLDYETLVNSYAEDRKLDASWIMGLMRSESAMAEDAVSSAGARGLMQVTPHTAQTLARRYKISYKSRSQLLQADVNLRFGTVYLRELLDRYDQNPVLASGAYNAGPRAVDRWLDSIATKDPAVWVEKLPYFETRDYIPRVLAFSTIYDWRMQQPVTRVSSRMPGFDSPGANVNMKGAKTAKVVCKASG